MARRTNHMNTIDINRPVADICAEHPELIDLLVNLGFKPLKNKLMRETLGRTVSLKKGAQLIDLPLDKLIKTLSFNGYQVADTEEDDQ